MKPIIGVVVREDENNKKYFLLNREVCHSIIKCGGIPIGIVPNMEDIDVVINLCDGFILPGGDYFNTFDKNFIKKIKVINKPLLGICLGMQTMGTGNIEKIENHTHKSFLKYVHYINIVSNTLLFKILKEKRILVNSRHYDCLKWTNLKISAVSDDGIIEAIENEKQKFFLGVQWHPETLIDIDSNSYQLFKYFIDICGE